MQSEDSNPSAEVKAPIPLCNTYLYFSKVIFKQQLLQIDITLDLYLYTGIKDLDFDDNSIYRFNTDCKLFFEGIHDMNFYYEWIFTDNNAGYTYDTSDLAEK